MCSSVRGSGLNRGFPARGHGFKLGYSLMMIAGVTSGINTLINYAQQQEQFNYERTWESRELVYARERAGMSYNRSRTE